LSNLWKFAFVIAVASLSGLASAEAVVSMAGRPPVLRAANAEAAIAQANAESAAVGEPASIAKAADGHYWAEATVNGRAVHFLVDTGASAVALTLDDARRLGIEPRDLNYTYQVTTAAGQVRAAKVTLATVAVAGAQVHDVDALVIEKGLATSLLGMTYLGRLTSFQATRQALVLQP
jgi:aspartyl protease family protein